MNLLEKLNILSAAAKYDVSCVSSGSSRANTNKGLGNAVAPGICHSWGDDGRCISLLKVLLTNHCIYDCVYCANRISNDIQRAAFTPDELIALTINFYQRNYIEGLFLSSGVLQSPDFTMDLMLRIVKKLRLEHNYNGYIHLKAIPGADSKLIYEAGLYVDRMSVNMELPSEAGLKLLAPQKTKQSIFKPMGFIGAKIYETVEERKRYKKMPDFVPAGQSTQVIIGATPESDYQILTLSENLYQKVNMRRVFYSAYIPINKDKNLPALAGPPLTREHRLYQADWLLRFYKFKASEILTESNPFLDDNFDPKTEWALRNIHIFPVEINKADYALLLRVPGIGLVSAQRIVAARKMEALRFDHLTKLGIVLKRAKYFITCLGKMYDKYLMETDTIRQHLLWESEKNRKKDKDQLHFFDLLS